MSTQSLYERQFEFQKGYYSEIELLLRKNAIHMIRIDLATEKQDKTQATDFVVTMEDQGNIAVRIRSKDIFHRDLTIRCYNQGFKTEIHKIIEGWARYYLYCWESKTRTLDEWMLVDLDIVRKKGLLNDWEKRRKVIPNPTDGGITRFIAIPYLELRSTLGCIIAANVILPH